MTISRSFALLMLTLPLHGEVPSGVPTTCIFPGDCKADVLGTHIGKCESFSAWKRQYQSATPEERRRMWAYAGKSMDGRLVEAYEANEEQKAQIETIVSEEIERHRTQMGEAYTEVAGYREKIAERLQEHIEAIKTAKEAEEAGKPIERQLPDPDQDMVLLELDKKIREIDDQYPVDWSTIADRIEKTLPAGQAERGRLRLSDAMPHRFTPRQRQPVRDTNPPGSHDPWDQYVAEFTKRYSLDAGQASSAQSILGELKEKSERTRLALYKELEAAESDGERALAQTRLASFDDVRDQLFEELKDRLKGLLTQSQLSFGDSGKTP